jgi:hypothetical protein
VLDRGGGELIRERGFPFRAACTLDDLGLS